MTIFAGVVAVVVAVLGASVIQHWRKSRRFPDLPDLAEVGATLKPAPGSRSGAVALEEPDEL